jgi:hypothetical protein
LEQVDKNGAKTFISGSKKGLGLYLKHGWVEVDEAVLDLSPYGGPKEEKTSFMMRESRGRKGI